MPSNTDNTTREWRDSTSTEQRDIYGSIRRMAITLTEGSFWRAVGHLLMDGRTRETRDAEVFGTLGFYSRPAPGANAESMLVSPGGPGNHVIIGTRDEDMRKMQPQLAQDSAMMRNRVAIVLVKPDGTAEIRAPGGVAVKLPTLADYEALRAAFNAHVHATAGTGTPSPPTAVPSVIPVPTPAGTQVLKGQ